MSARRTLLSMTMLIAAVSCLDTPFVPVSDAQVRIINASNSRVSIAVDGAPQLDDVVPSSVSAFFVRQGPHTFAFQGPNVNGLTLDVQAVSQGVTTAYLHSTDAGTVAATTLDTGSTVPLGKSKVRVSLLTKTLG